MTRESLLILAAALMLTLTGSATAQQPVPPKADPEPTDSTEPLRYRGFLPMNWGQIGLSDAQKQEIYKRQAKYKEEIRELERKIAELKSQERKELYGVLTDTQKERLRKIILEKIGGLEPAPEPEDPKK